MDFAGHYSRVLKYVREKLDVQDMHPDLFFTRLGAHLRQATAQDDTIGHLSKAVLTNVGANGQRKLMEPLDTTSLSALRDAVLENPEHPLAKSFNWERLPEKVQVDNHWRKVLADYAPDTTARQFLTLNGDDRVLKDFFKREHPWLDKKELSASAARVDRHQETANFVNEHPLLFSNPDVQTQWHDETARMPAYEHTEHY